MSASSGSGKRDADPEAPGHVCPARGSTSSTVVSRGSSAMPQMGQLPGSCAADLRVHGTGEIGARGWRGDGRRFKRHAALRAGARTHLVNLGVHRADVLGVPLCRSDGCGG